MGGEVLKKSGNGIFHIKHSDKILEVMGDEEWLACSKIHDRLWENKKMRRHAPHINQLKSILPLMVGAQMLDRRGARGAYEYRKRKLSV